jgi:hypothetical protein
MKETNTMIIEAQNPLYFEDSIIQEIADIQEKNKEMPVVVTNLYD